MSGNDERRLADRVLAALELALDQEARDVVEPLRVALELSLTRFGGPGAVERRELPEGVVRALERCEALRRTG